MNIAEITSGINVNVNVNDEIYTGEVIKVFKNNKVKIRFEDGSTQNISHKDLSLRRPGRKSLQESLTEEERQEQIESMLEALRSTDDQGKKKNFRAALRRLGHRGGLSSVDS